MTTRPTTLVESDQLAQAAANVIKTDDFAPKGKRWPFSRTSKVHKDYDKAVQEITVRRREAREAAVERKLEKDRSEADSLFERAKHRAHQEYDGRIAEAKKPYDETEAKARSIRDAAIAAANLAYQQAIDEAKKHYLQSAGVIEEERDAIIASAHTTHKDAYAALDAQRKNELAKIARDLRIISFEGPMRIVEDKQVWSPEERKKALIAIVDMVGRDDLDPVDADICLQNVAGYVFQDRYLKPDAQHHRLMDTNLLEALVELARRDPLKRPTIVKYMHEIVTHNPGHSSAAFIRGLTELYVIASADTTTVYSDDAVESENIVERMRAHIADTLRLTPRRSQVPSPTMSHVGAREATGVTRDDDQKTPVMARGSNADITADVDIAELLSAESSES